MPRGFPHITIVQSLPSCLFLSQSPATIEKMLQNVTYAGHYSHNRRSPRILVITSDPIGDRAQGIILNAGWHISWDFRRDDDACVLSHGFLYHPVVPSYPHVLTEIGGNIPNIYSKK
ncbi:MAG: hypothetical protein RLZZ338_4622 [Cyanobacteriota bacterium]